MLDCCFFNTLAAKSKRTYIYTCMGRGRNFMFMDDQTPPKYSVIELATDGQ